MLLGFLLLIFGFIIGPVFLDEDFAEYLGNAATPFVSAAAFLLLVSANIMQQKELGLQRDELQLQRKELTATKEVFMEQSNTMSRQRFENTFFNMINLHHNLLEHIKYDGLIGREVIKELHDDLNKIYQKEIYEHSKARVVNILANKNPEDLTRVAKLFYLDNEASNFIDTFNDDNNNHYLSKKKEEALRTFDSVFGNDKIKCEEMLNRINYKKYLGENIVGLKDNVLKELLDDDICVTFINDFTENYYENPLKEYKILAFETLNEKSENVIGQYHKNILKVMELIDSMKFYEDQAVNVDEQRNYREIVAAQLSSYELIMLFYYAVYSRKGEGFAKLVNNKNFFEDNIIKEDFLWRNDGNELLNLG